VRVGRGRKEDAIMVEKENRYGRSGGEGRLKREKGRWEKRKEYKE
jgi:hypothetical protein